jgi:formamidopyrimidine-DNA glycosylase
MPELPEVETIRQNLRSGDKKVPSLIGLKISGALIGWEGSLAAPTPELFLARLTGQVINEIGRRGKFFDFKLSQDHMLVHLRMSGDLVVELQDISLDPYARLVIYFENGWRLSFNDTRKFGRVWLLENPSEVLDHLGPEPLDPNFSAADFYERIKNKKRQLKPLLLDQRFLAGVGNIYADEALFLAGIHPQKKTNQLSKSEIKNLFDAIRKVLEDGIANNGASIDWVYRGGEQQHHFRVYDRKGKHCYSCNSPIEKILVGQRGTHFCPFCQSM